MSDARIPNEMVFDEDGFFAEEMSPFRVESTPSRKRAKGGGALRKLKGSWFFHLRPSKGTAKDAIRGVMRLEAGPDALRVSGDVYVRGGSKAVPEPPVITPDPLVIGDHWYPSFPQSEYRWYFRSSGASFKKRLFFRFVRHLWDPQAKDFVAQDRGWMRLRSRKKKFSDSKLPRPTLRMTGVARVGGKKYDVVATHTSPYYRGCLVEVDVMRGREWPAKAPDCDREKVHTLRNVFRANGVDALVVVSDLDLPDDPKLAHFELQELMKSHRSVAGPGERWSMWMLVGSQYQMNDALGVMFDIGSKPYREGAAVFYDSTLPRLLTIHPKIRGKPLGTMPLALLRTIAHEAGHVLNLFHPKHDEHQVAVGKTLMNQGGDLLLFATEENPYPCVAAMTFNSHNRSSLAHSCDPQVQPGWKPFGWGHGRIHGGLPQPVDARGLAAAAPAADGLALVLELPDEVVRGDYVMALLTLENRGGRRRRVSAGLRLARGDLRLRIVDAEGRHGDLRDVITVCTNRTSTEIDPGGSLVAAQQLFYTSRGLTFDRPGRYRLCAELDVGDLGGGVARSEWVEMAVRPAATRAERARERLSMDPDVGLSLALGGFGSKEGVERKLARILDRYGSTDLGRACGLTLANAYSRDLRDLRAGKVLRAADPKAAERALARAMKGARAAHLARLADSVASPGAESEPVIERLSAALESARNGAFKGADLSRARSFLAGRSH